jgi:hypothetical protein
MTDPVALDLARPADQWTKIFAEQTDGTPEQIAARIIKDLWGYGHGYKHLKKYMAQDTVTLANALRAMGAYDRP